MKQAILLIFLAFAAGCSMQKVESQKMETPKIADEKAGDKSKKSPVLVELFTSEGCSSCPPADKALMYLQNEQPFEQAEIIALSQHVDYWDGASWRDPFSSPLFSERQTVYARKLSLDSTYTPQMIVDGRVEFVGSDLKKASKAIVEAAKTPKAKIETALDGGQLKINISELPAHEKATIYLAIAENNLASNVKGGENSGARLEHTAVVRELKTLGAIDGKTGEFAVQTNLELKTDWKKANLKYVIFVQENDSRKILGVTKLVG